MKILAVDTSSLVAAVAVTEDTVTLGEYLLNHRKTHSQQLMPMIQSLLRDLGMQPADVDVFAASEGPGSFTGLRIGITSIKAMAYAVNKPVMAVPTLDALAYNIYAPQVRICPMMDARNRQVYTAVYQAGNPLPVPMTQAMGIPVEELAALLKQEPTQVIFTGDAAGMYRSYLEQELGDSACFAPHNQTIQRASSVAAVAYWQMQQEGCQSSFDMVPFYLRKSQAERELDRKNVEGEI